MSIKYKSNVSLDYFSTFVIATFFLLFASWTIAVNLSTFLNVRWSTLSRVFTLLIPALIVVFSIFSHRFAKGWCEALSIRLHAARSPDGTVLGILFVATFLIFLLESYPLRFAIFAVAVIVIRIVHSQSQPPSALRVTRSEYDWPAVLLLFCTCASALFVALFAVRPDLDDASFLQIALQTLAYPDKAPFSFDASLGEVIERFRFAPYRFTSYEILVAFLSELIGVSAGAAYYILLPGVSATLSVLVAYTFCRWFTDSPMQAAVGAAIFVVVVLAWGETHISFGNRLFVRLFQGKGLLIALTTPFTVVVGILLSQRPKLINVVMLAAANVCALGVSSSGLVLTVFTTAIVAALCTTARLKRTILLYLLIGATMIYPVGIAYWLKFITEQQVSLTSVGTYLPIDASFGLDLREATLLSALLLGYAVIDSNKNRAFGIIVLTSVLVLLNPWLSDAVSDFTSRNMSWRVAWSAPIPLLLTVSLLAPMIAMQNGNARISRLTRVSVRGLSLLLIIVFLFSYSWTLSSDNNVSWSRPGSKFEPNFYIAREISEKISQYGVNGRVLAHHSVAAWLPITSPGTELVMPGHTYPIQLETILSRSDFDERTELYNLISGFSSITKNLNATLARLQVEWLIVSPRAPEILGLLGTDTDEATRPIETVEMFSVADYRIYRVIRNND